MLPDFELERFFAKHEFSVKHLLCASDCESMSVGDLLRLADEADSGLDTLQLGYTEAVGSPTLRASIAAMYETITANEVLVFSGAEEAIFLFANGMLGPDDHVIVHGPCYQSLFEVAAHRCGSIDRWMADANRGWQLDLNQLDDLLRENTKAIIINTPHNPTGWLMSRHDWCEMHKRAADRGIIVFCDEVYRESEYDPADRLPAGCDMSGSAVSLGVMSKTYGLAGLRIGWVATQNREVLHRLQSLKDYTTICNSAPSEFLAELALNNRQKLISRNIKIIEDNLALLDSFFQRHSARFSWARPQAGAIAFPQLLGDETVDGFCQRLLSQAGVLLAPGTMFHDAGNHFRIGFGRSNFAEGLSALERFLLGH